MKWFNILIALAPPIFAAPLAIRQAAPSRALWLWDSRIIRDAASVTKFMRTATNVNYRISTVHALVNRDIDNSVWSSFITKCNKAGIQVEALMGDAQWIVGKTCQDCDTLQQQLDWLKQYQTSSSVPSTGKFSAIHTDIEAWALPDFSSNTATYVSSLTKLQGQVSAVARSLNIKTAADIPFWAYTVKCEDRTLDICMLNYADSLTFMSYRNTAANLLDISNTAFKKIASATTANKPLWLAVETKAGSADQALISYAGSTVSSMMTDLSTVDTSMQKSFKDYAGVAIHSYETLVNMAT